MSTDEALYEAARQARENSLALYSHFKVGAALLCSDGTIYPGCNIESSSYGLTICAERTALFKALSEGRREFSRIQIIADTAELTPPCGACRQLLWDFAPGIQVTVSNLLKQTRTYLLADLLPYPFGKKFL
jgi:cytidine deaminase